MPSDTPPVIGFICGSLRAASINKQLEKALIKQFKRSGFKTTSIDLGRYDLPLYHGDLSTPAPVKTLARKLKTCDGIVVVSPEYNGGLPPVLKNAVDWISILGTDAFKSSYCCLLYTSPSPRDATLSRMPSSA